MNETVVRNIIARIGREVHLLGSNTDNGPDIQMADVRAWDIFEGGYTLGDDTTGFDDPYARLGTQYSINRKTVHPKEDGRGVACLYNPEIKQLCLVDANGNGASVIWCHDNGHDEWLEYAQSNWRKTYEFDSRHLTDSELEALYAITHDIVNRHPGNSTHVTYHFRATQEQVQRYLERKAVPYVQGQYNPYYISRSYRFDDPITKVSSVERFLKTAPQSLIDEATRIIDIFQKLDIKPVDMDEYRNKTRDAFMSMSSFRRVETGDLPPVPETISIITVDCEGRGEGFQGGWPLATYVKKSEATKAKEKADELLAIYLDGTDPEAAGEAAASLYAMFPRLQREDILDEGTTFGLETVDHHK